MKLLVATLMALTACIGCVSIAAQDVPITPMPKPEVISEFKVGDKVIVTFPDESTLNGQVTEIGPMAEWIMLDGSIEKSRRYVVSVSRQIPITNDNGDTVFMTIVVEMPVPEFAVVLQKRPSERK